VPIARYLFPGMLMVATFLRCPMCGDRCPPDGVFCIRCGAPLTQAMTRTTQLLRRPLTLWPWRHKTLLLRSRRSIRQRRIVSAVALFGLARFTLVILIAAVGSSTPVLDPVGWLFVLAGAIHLVRGTRRGEPLSGMRYAVLCAALPVAQITQACVTPTLRFGGAAAIRLLVPFLVGLLPRRRWHP